MADDNQPPQERPSGSPQPFDPNKTQSFSPGPPPVPESEPEPSQSPPQQPPWGGQAPPQQPPWGGQAPPQQPPWGGQPGAPQSWGAPPPVAPPQQPSWGPPPQGGAPSWTPYAPAGGPVGLASWGQRVGASLLDGLIVGALVMVAFLVSAVVGFVLGLVSDALGAIVGGLIAFAAYLAVLVAVVLMEAGPYGQTPGKHVMRIKVVQTDGRMLSKGQSVGRYFAKMISALPCYLGLLWPLWDQERRTFHDMILNTRVVTTPQQAPSLAAIFKAPFKGAS